MRKSIILASFLFASSSFAYSGERMKITIGFTEDAGANYNAPLPCSVANPEGWTGCEQFNWPYYTGSDTCIATYYVCEIVDNCPAGSSEFGMSNGNFCKPDSCPAGQSNITGYCSPIDPAIGAPLPDPMNDFNNDPAGCDSAGGYYFADGSCNGGGEALAKIMSDPTAVIGALLTVGGLAFSGAGVAALPLTAGGSSLAVAAGGYATVAGLGMMGLTAAGLMASTSQPASDVTSGENRIKVSLTTSGGSGGASSGSNVTKTNTTTGKVEQTLFVPEATKTAMSNSSNVDKTNATLLNPIGLEGTVSTSYNYTDNTATTITHEAGSTSATPITTTKTTSITVSQNPDGTVTTTPTDTTVAPTVSGSNGGSITSPSTTSGTVGTGTGGSTGSGPDYTGVLNDIKKNTGDSASFLDKILGMFDNTDSVDTSKASGSNADGHEGFGGFKGDIEGSLDGFVFTDPLGLNGMGGAGIASYGFTILGHHYIILDQAMIDKLPLSLLRNLFLFLAALAGLITVVSGV